MKNLITIIVATLLFESCNRSELNHHQKENTEAYVNYDSLVSVVKIESLTEQLESLKVQLKYSISLKTVKYISFPYPKKTVFANGSIVNICTLGDTTLCVLPFSKVPDDGKYALVVVK